MNKKILVLGLLGILLLVVMPLGSVSAELGKYCGENGTPCIDSIDYLLPTITSTLWMIFAAVAIVCFIIAGLLFMTSSGAPDKLAKARSAFMWGIVGVVVAIIAYSIVVILENALAGGVGSNHGCRGGEQFYVSVGGNIPSGAVQVSGGYCH